MNKIKLLVVDDEMGLTSMLKITLEKSGKYEVMTENFGAKAVNTALKYKPDLIILDIMMPDMIGSEVAAELLNCEETKDIKILFMTALISRHETEATHGKIANRSFIAKLVDLSLLNDTIRNILH